MALGEDGEGIDGFTFRVKTIRQFVFLLRNFLMVDCLQVPPSQVAILNSLAKGSLWLSTSSEAHYPKTSLRLSFPLQLLT